MEKDPYKISDIRSKGLSYPFYFISDAHLSTVSEPEQNERIEAILVLLEEVRKSRGVLFIMGDFFDFWFSKGKFIPPNLEVVIELLSKIATEGIEIHYIAGNHDFWVEGFIKEKIGFQFYPNALSFIFKGKQFFVHHGDMVSYKGKIYPLIRKVIRSFWAIGLLKLLPIRFTYFLGEKVSQYNYEHDDIPLVANEHILGMKNYLWNKTAEGYDLALSGHVHFPLEESKDGKQIAILGDWIHHRTYGYMDENGFKLVKMEV